MIKPEWKTPTTVGIARYIMDGWKFHALPVLADALEDAGCDDHALLLSMRTPKPTADGTPAWDGSIMPELDALVR